MNGMAVKPLKRAVIKEEYIALCGDMTEAVILNQMIYWSRRVRDYDELLEEEKERRRMKNSEVSKLPFLHGWIHKSAAEMKDEIMCSASPRTVLRKLDALVKKGFLDRRSNPEHPYDRIYQYRVNFNALCRALAKLGYSLEGYKVETDDTKENDGDIQSCKSKGHADLMKRQNDLSKGQTEHWNRHGVPAIPETIAENTAKNTAKITASSSYSPSKPKDDDEDDRGVVSDLLAKIGIDKIRHKDMIEPVSGLIADLLRTGKTGKTKYNCAQVKDALGCLRACDIDTVIDRYTQKAAAGEVRNADSFLKACLVSAGKSAKILALSKKSGAEGINCGNPSFDVDEYVRLSMKKLHME
jgi:DNA-binding HxlR family transcriptional regulator